MRRRLGRVAAVIFIAIAALHIAAAASSSLDPNRATVMTAGTDLVRRVIANLPTPCAPSSSSPHSAVHHDRVMTLGRRVGRGVVATR
jgi:hypothetical protein